MLRITTFYARRLGTMCWWLLAFACGIGWFHSACAVLRNPPPPKSVGMCGCTRIPPSVPPGSHVIGSDRLALIPLHNAPSC